MEEEIKRGGGPKTDEGKARSSQNSTTHGARALTLILRDESREDYERVEEGWRREFEPQGYQEERLVDILVRADWFFKRAERRWMEAEAEGAEQHRLELMQRYKTTAERSFWRAWNAVRGLRKDVMRLDDRDKQRDEAMHELRAECMQLQAKLNEQALRARAEGERVKAQTNERAGRSKTKKNEKLEVLEQWVEVGISKSGETVTTFYPSNSELQKRVAKREQTPDLVYRRLFFLGEVPREYAWTTSDAGMAHVGGLGTQRMTWEQWQRQIAQECVSVGGHLKPCGGNIPRPAERGGCECEVCSGNHWMLAAAGFK